MKKIKNFLFIHFAFFIYSLGSLCSKKAGTSDTFITFCLFYGFVFFFLILYAILWQKILNKNSLVVAYLNKGVTILWGVLYGLFFFKESIGVIQILGILLIVIGIGISNFGEAK